MTAPRIVVSYPTNATVLAYPPSWLFVLRSVVRHGGRVEQEQIIEAHT